MNLTPGMSVDYNIDFGRITIGPPPVPKPDPAAPLFAAVDGRVASLSNSECIFQARDGGELHVMTHQVLQALDQCREFRPLDEHVARVAGVIPGLTGQGDAVRRVLTGLIERGLLRSDGEFIAAMRQSQARAPTPFRAHVIRACDRPAQLRSLLDGFRQQAAEVADAGGALIVIDDSRQAEAAREQRRLVAEHAQTAGVDARYVGRDETDAIAARLAKGRPEARAAVEALLLPREGAFGGGRGYNLALLLTAGGRLALFDDDYRLPIRRAHDARGGLELNPQQAYAVHFHADVDAALVAGETLAEDGLGLHRALAGRRLGDLFAAHGDLLPVREHLRGQTLSRLAHLRGDARILATYVGTRGASGAGEAVWLYDIDPASRATFWLDRESYLRNCNGDSIEYAPSRAQLRPFGLFTPFAVDNGELLPCTAPTGRGEDGLFGVVGHYLYPDSLTLHLPMTIGHVQEGRRSRYERAMRPLTPGFNRFLREWVRNQAQPARSADAGERLAFLAAQLEDLAGASEKERVSMLEEYLRYVRADLIERLQQQLLSAPEAPVYWAADVRRIVEVNGKALLAGAPPRLDEWPDGIDHAACAERLRASCLELANAYRHWPALWRTAAELGERLWPGR